MTDAFAHLIPEARIFLAELAANNTREWFNANKTRYQTFLKTPAQLLQEQVRTDLSRTIGQSVSAKLFRPQRDVRFSKDKTPYHTHLHMMWTIHGDLDFGLFLGLSPKYCKTGGGVMNFSKAQLINWRTAVNGDVGDAVSSQLDALAQQHFTSDAPELKRVPTPYGKDHPQETLLRRKSLSVWRNLPEAECSSLQSSLTNDFSKLMPLRDTLFESLA